VTPMEGVFAEATAVPRVRSVKLAHLSIELGHLYMDDFKAGPDRLVENFRGVRPWATTAEEACAGSVRGRPRISTCFLVDDYFTRFSSPAEVVPALLGAAEATGLRIDYVARESACAVADGVELARLVQQRLVEEPPVGSNGSRPPSGVTGWLCNGERSPSDRPAEAMAVPLQWRPPRQSAFRNHSIFIDVELWRDETGGERLWSCPFLAAVWQLQRLGLLRSHGEPVGEPQPMTVAELPAEWDALPPVVQLNPDAAPFSAYRTFSALGSRFLGIEVAVRTILSQVSIDPVVAAQVVARAAGEGFPLPGEVVERIGYAFL